MTKATTLALKFLREEKTSLSNCIERLNKHDNVLAVQAHKYYVFYLFIDGSALRTNITGSEIIAWGDIACT